MKDNRDFRIKIKSPFNNRKYSLNHKVNELEAQINLIKALEAVQLKYITKVVK